MNRTELGRLSRRAFLTSVAAATLAATRSPAEAQAPAIPIIDSHIHLFDPTRPQGAPYSGPQPAPGAAPIPAYPERYRTLAVPLGVVGAIHVEASPWIEDNLWVLEVAQRDPIMVGVIGNLEPDKPEFPEYLERYHKNPLFRGIRYGNLWGRDITKQATNPNFLGGLKLLAEADLMLDTANPRVPVLEAIIRISDAVPNSHRARSPAVTRSRGRRSLRLRRRYRSSSPAGPARAPGCRADRRARRCPIASDARRRTGRSP